jgi:hypothetical protein
MDEANSNQMDVSLQFESLKMYENYFVSTRDIYIDSSRRSEPYGNVYTMFIQNPMKNVKQVDLVSAVVPNTMYNITNSSVFSIHDLTTLVDTQVQVDPGFYSACSLANAINNNQSLILADMLDGEGKFIFSNIVPFTTGFSIKNATSEFSSITGIGQNEVSVFGNTININYANNWNLKSLNVINMHPTGNFVFLEIDQLRPPYPIDAVQDPVKSESFLKFATIPMDTISGTTKIFKENSDYKISVHYPTPIDKVDRLTIRWLDTNGNVLNFNGVDQNSLILRFHLLNPPELYSKPKLIDKVFENKSIVFYFIITFVIIIIILFI